MIAIRTSFSPQTNGFRFVNRFDFPYSVSFKLPFTGSIDLGDIIYGLCGGMCFAALDYFLVGKPVPQIDDPQKLDSNYVLYLWERQLDSLGLLTVPKVIELMLREDIDAGRRTAQYEIPKLRRRLDQGLPTVLALIRTRRGDDPTRNHQVLVTGYDFDPLTKKLAAHLYEPNYPGQEPTLNFDLSQPSLGIHPAQSTGEPLRAFFVIPYNQESPR
jgi:hypothetical protein